jgi:Domain of unknown function (DUF397)
VRLFDNKDIMQYRSGADPTQNWRKSSRSMTDGTCVEVSGLARHG